MITVCVPRAEDCADWERLYQGYAEFYDLSLTAETLATVWAWIHDDHLAFHALVAKDEQGRVVGLAHYKPLLSPLRGATVGVLDDLYVDPDIRGEGVADALLAALKADAEARGWPFVRWITRDHNYRARAVYDKYATRTDWVTYQMATAPVS